MGIDVLDGAKDSGGRVEHLCEQCWVPTKTIAPREVGRLACSKRVEIAGIEVPLDFTFGLFKIAPHHRVTNVKHGGKSRVVGDVARNVFGLLEGFEIDCWSAVGVVEIDGDRIGGGSSLTVHLTCDACGETIRDSHQRGARADLRLLRSCR